MLPTFPFDDYPIMTDISGGKSFSISSVDLQNLIDNTKFAISLEETRYYLNGIFLHQNDNLLRAVATDGHRLAQAEINLPTGAEGMPSIIIPRKTVGELRKLLDDQNSSKQNLVSARVMIDKQSVYLNSFVINSGSNRKIKKGTE